MTGAETSSKKDARASILDAAAGEFAESGFAGARVDEIARRAGVNKAMLYYHVGNKSALYEAVLLRWMDQLFEELDRRISPETDAEEQLAALAGTFEALVGRNPQYPQILVREFSTGGQNLSPRVMTKLLDLFRREGRILSEGRRAGTLRKAGPITVHILLVVGTVMHLMGRQIRERILALNLGDIPEIPASPSQVVVDLLLNGLKVHPPCEKGAARPGVRPSKEHPIRPAAHPRRHKENSR